MRNNVGTDFSNYLNYYNNSTLPNFINQLKISNYEISYLMINVIAKIFGSFKIVLFISAFLTIYPVMKIYKRYKMKNLTLFYLLYTFIVFFQSFNLIKQGIAISLGFYAIISFLNNKKLMRFLILTLVCMSFHISGIIIILVPFMTKFLNVRTKYRLYAVIFVLLIFSIFNYEILHVITNNKFLISYNYLLKMNVQGNNYEFFLKLALSVLLILVYRKNKNFYIIFSLVLLDLFFTYLGFTQSYIKRIGLYYNVFQLILLANLDTNFISNERKTIKGMVALYSLSYFIIFYYIIGHANLIPYRI